MKFKLILLIVLFKSFDGISQSIFDIFTIDNPTPVYTPTPPTPEYNTPHEKRILEKSTDFSFEKKDSKRVKEGTSQTDQNEVENFSVEQSKEIDFFTQPNNKDMSLSTFTTPTYIDASEYNKKMQQQKDEENFKKSKDEIIKYVSIFIIIGFFAYACVLALKGSPQKMNKK